MDALKAEIERKRKSTASLHGEVAGLSTKCMRQGDYRQLLEKEREETLRLLEEERKFKSAKMENSAGASLVPSSKPAHSSSSVLDSLSVEDVQQKLQELQQPATVFGESQQERVTRLVKAISAANELADLQESGGADDDQDDGKGNDKEDEDEDGEDDRRGRREEPAFGSIIYSAQTNLSKEKAVYKYFRSLLRQWESDLGTREEREKMSAKGKADFKTHRQCKDHIRPLFKMCKKKTVPPDILEKLFYMVKFCEEGNFRVAHDHYYVAAIGNAAWPIGLTMVGIHERSGREKINTGKVAHVMNNELQRKYLTAVKRLMSFAQTKRPDVPPSMKVL
jgi:pre-mRNA-splicing factor 18